MDAPPEFSPLIGQDKAVLLLTQAVKKQRVAPAYSFLGPVGVGRSLAARCFAKYLFSATGEEKSQQADASELHRRLSHRIDQGNHPDLLWVSPTYLHQGKRFTVAEAEEAGLKRKTPPQVRLEQIREVARFVARPALEAPRSLVIIDQAETMAEAAANALLKTLEEPGNATLILTAPSPDSILPTLVSRCQRIPFVPLQSDDFDLVLRSHHQEEILQNPALVAMAQGSPGAAIHLWQTLQEIPEDILSLAQSLPKTPKQALAMAGQITKGLSSEQQIWLISYLQRQLWQPTLPQTTQAVQQLELAKKRLLQYVQPLLTWEVLLLQLAGLIPFTPEA